MEHPLLNVSDEAIAAIDTAGFAARPSGPNGYFSLVVGGYEVALEPVLLEPDLFELAVYDVSDGGPAPFPELVHRKKLQVKVVRAK
jgi:hypothetical protein